MRSPADSREWTERARIELRAVRELLRRPTPEALRQCAPRLEQATGNIEALESWLMGGGAPRGAGLRTELGEIRGELAQVSALLEGAAGFYEGLGQLLRTAACGYGPGGSRQDWQPGPRLVTEG